MLDTVAELFRPSIKIRTHSCIFSLAIDYKVVLKTVFVKCAGLFKKLQPVVTAFRQLLHFIQKKFRDISILISHTFYLPLAGGDVTHILEKYG
ncbi:MAG TPA: hypothetical protein DCG28_01860 [Lachnospiraceae bacterium]|nr:hypothetical protein [Lachnospiraceae bacterium]